MTSYSDKDDEENVKSKSKYPTIFLSQPQKTVQPVNSEFDQKVARNKRKISISLKESQPSQGGNVGEVRKFHRKF